MMLAENLRVRFPRISVSLLCGAMLPSPQMCSRDRSAGLHAMLQLVHGVPSQIPRMAPLAIHFFTKLLTSLRSRSYMTPLLISNGMQANPRRRKRFVMTACPAKSSKKQPRWPKGARARSDLKRLLSLLTRLSELGGASVVRGRGSRTSARAVASLWSLRRRLLPGASQADSEPLRPFDIGEGCCLRSIFREP